MKPARYLDRPAKSKEKQLENRLAQKFSVAGSKNWLNLAGKWLKWRHCVSEFGTPFLPTRRTVPPISALHGDRNPKCIEKTGGLDRNATRNKDIIEVNLSALLMLLYELLRLCIEYLPSFRDVCADFISWICE